MAAPSNGDAKIGILIVGLGGNNGTTLLAGQIANARSLSWETSAAGRVSAPCWHGCVTQLAPRGDHGGVGFAGRYPLADAGRAAVGGWDVRPTPCGDALYANRVLEYDLVRQVREEMNQVEIMRGVYDPSFVGESQHATATHIVTDEECPGPLAKMKRIRRDIRSFIEKNDVDGHTTVIWSASVERPAAVSFEDGTDLLGAIFGSSSDPSLGADISPSILYAVAAALEGCSFVNGGSQNTLSPATGELFDASYRSLMSSVVTSVLPSDIFAGIRTNPAYLLGTDFKAGQTKFKTAAVEYIRALGLVPRVVASSNHLGNNDMLNLTSKTTLPAKMAVKSNIFGPWREHELDHQVKVMYAPFMGDEKRDVVEYTSLGYLHSPHTMLTYTRAMDSVLCVPLMVDVAVWCDYFARCGADAATAGRATAYLFKVPEGGAVGVDPGFFYQMKELEDVLREMSGGGAADDVTQVLMEGVAAGIIDAEQASALRVLAKNK